MKIFIQKGFLREKNYIKQVNTKQKEKMKPFFLHVENKKMIAQKTLLTQNDRENKDCHGIITNDRLEKKTGTNKQFF